MDHKVAVGSLLTIFVVLTASLVVLIQQLETLINFRFKYQMLLALLIVAEKCKLLERLISVS
jgi:hypothetical protein